MTTEAIPDSTEVLDSTETEEADTGETTEQAEETEVDWKARAELAEQTLGKERNDKRSQDVNKLKQQERDDLTLEIRDRLAANEKSTDALLRALGTGDTENLPDEIEKIRAESRETLTRSSYQTRHDALAYELADSVKDEAGNSILDLQTAPELEPMRTEWVRARDAQDIVGLTRALSMAHKAVLTKERALSKVAVEDEKKRTKDARRKALEEVEAHDLDVGTGTGGGEDTSVHGVSRMAKALNKQE